MAQDESIYEQVCKVHGHDYYLSPGTSITMVCKKCGLINREQNCDGSESQGYFVKFGFYFKNTLDNFLHHNQNLVVAVSREVHRLVSEKPFSTFFSTIIDCQQRQ